MYATAPHLDSCASSAASYLVQGGPVSTIQRLGTIPEPSVSLIYLPTSSIELPETFEFARNINLAKVAKHIRSFVQLPIDWDGYGGIPASQASASDALELLVRTPKYSRIPKAMLSGDGEVSLYWDSSHAYAEASFPGDGTFHFFTDTPNAQNIIDGDDIDVRSNFPADLRRFLIHYFG